MRGEILELLVTCKDTKSGDVDGLDRCFSLLTQEIRSCLDNGPSFTREQREELGVLYKARAEICHKICDINGIIDDCNEALRFGDADVEVLLLRARALKISAASVVSLDGKISILYSALKDCCGIYDVDVTKKDKLLLDMVLSVKDGIEDELLSCIDKVILSKKKYYTRAIEDAGKTLRERVMAQMEFLQNCCRLLTDDYLRYSQKDRLIDIRELVASEKEKLIRMQDAIVSCEQAKKSCDEGNWCGAYEFFSRAALGCPEFRTRIYVDAIKRFDAVRRSQSCANASKIIINELMIKIFIELDDYEHAVRCYDDILEINSKNFKAFHERGKLKLEWSRLKSESHSVLNTKHKIEVLCGVVRDCNICLHAFDVSSDERKKVECLRASAQSFLAELAKKELANFSECCAKILADSEKTLDEIIVAQKEFIARCLGLLLGLGMEQYMLVCDFVHIKRDIVAEQEKLSLMLRAKSIFERGVGEESSLRGCELLIDAARICPVLSRAIYSEQNALRRREELDRLLDKSELPETLIRIYEAKAQIYEGLGCYQEGIFNFSQVLSIDPENFTALFNRGRLREEYALKRTPPNGQVAQEQFIVFTMFFKMALVDFQTAQSVAVRQKFTGYEAQLSYCQEAISRLRFSLGEIEKGVASLVKKSQGREVMTPASHRAASSDRVASELRDFASLVAQNVLIERMTAAEKLRTTSPQGDVVSCAVVPLEVGRLGVFAEQERQRLAAVEPCDADEVLHCGC